MRLPTLPFLRLLLVSLINGFGADMLPWYKKLLYILIAPFVIGVWCVMNPRKVWEQAKKDFGIEQ